MIPGLQVSCLYAICVLESNFSKLTWDYCGCPNHIIRPGRHRSGFHIAFLLMSAVRIQKNTMLVDKVV